MRLNRGQSTRMKNNNDNNNIIKITVRRENIVENEKLYSVFFAFHSTIENGIFKVSNVIKKLKKRKRENK